MNIIIKGNIEITEGIRNKVNKQVAKLNRFKYVNANGDTHVKVDVHGRRQAVTVHVPTVMGGIISAHCCDENLYNAVDEVVEKLKGQLRKMKVQNDKTKRNSICENVLEFLEDIDSDSLDEEE